jgi:hypothetical protein
MIWPRRRRKKPTTEQVAALRARAQAELQYRKAEREHAAALTLVEALREIREKNHFGSTLESLNWGKK